MGSRRFKNRKIIEDEIKEEKQIVEEDSMEYEKSRAKTTRVVPLDQNKKEKSRKFRINQVLSKPQK